MDLLSVGNMIWILLISHLFALCRLTNLVKIFSRTFIRFSRIYLVLAGESHSLLKPKYLLNENGIRRLKKI